MHIARQKIRNAKAVEQEVWKMYILHTSRYYDHAFVALNLLLNQRNTNDQRIQQYRPTIFSTNVVILFVVNSPFDAFRLNNNRNLLRVNDIVHPEQANHQR